MSLKNVGYIIDTRQQPNTLTTFLGSASNGKRNVSFIDSTMANIYFQVLVCRPKFYHC